MSVFVFFFFKYKAHIIKLRKALKAEAEGGVLLRSAVVSPSSTEGVQLPSSHIGGGVRARSKGARARVCVCCRMCGAGLLLIPTRSHLWRWQPVRSTFSRWVQWASVCSESRLWCPGAAAAGPAAARCMLKKVMSCVFLWECVRSQTAAGLQAELVVSNDRTVSCGERMENNVMRRRRVTRHFACGQRFSTCDRCNNTQHKGTDRGTRDSRRPQTDLIGSLQ